MFVNFLTCRHASCPLPYYDWQTVNTFLHSVNKAKSGFFEAADLMSLKNGYRLIVPSLLLGYSVSQGITGI